MVAPLLRSSWGVFGPGQAVGHRVRAGGGLADPCLPDVSDEEARPAVDAARPPGLRHHDRLCGGGLPGRRNRPTIGSVGVTRAGA